MHPANRALAGLNLIGAQGGAGLIFGFGTSGLGCRLRTVNWQQRMVFQANRKGWASVWRLAI